MLVGTTGMGGGSLMTPLLILVFGIKPVVAIGTDLAYGAVTKTVGGWRHLRKGTVDMGLALWLAHGSVPGALGGVVVLDRLHAAYGDEIDTWVLAARGRRARAHRRAGAARALFLPKVLARERDTIAPLETRHKLAACVLGLTVGFVLGVTSAGSGALIAVGLIVLFRLRPRRVVGTDVFHAAILLWVAGAGALRLGQRRPRAGGDDPDRLRPGRVARRQPIHAHARERASPDARDRPDRLGARVAQQGRGARARGPDRRGAGRAGDLAAALHFGRRPRLARRSPEPALPASEGG